MSNESISPHHSSLITHHPLLVGAGLAAVAGVGVGAAAASVPPLVLLTGVAAAGALAATLYRPWIGLVLCVAVATLVPFGVMPIRIVFSPTFLDLTLSFLLVGWVLRMVRRREPWAATPVDGLVLLFMGLAIVSLALGTGYASIPGEQLRLFLKLLNSILLFFSAVQVVRSQHELAGVVRALILGGAGAATIALVLYALPREEAEGLLVSLGAIGYSTGPDVIRTIAGTDILRATGTSVDPNVLGAVLMVIGILVAAQLLSAAPVLPRPLLVGVAVAMGLAMVLTYSRSAWVGLAAGLAVLALFRDGRAWIGLALAAGAVAILPQGQILFARLMSAAELRDQATLMRLGEYRDALALIAQYPVFGVGFGDAPRVDLSVGVSSLYLLVAERMGLAGLGVFLALIATALARSCRVRAPRTSPMWGIGGGLQAALVAALVAGLFDHYFFNIRLPHMVALFWLIVGLLQVTDRYQHAPGPQTQGVDSRSP